MQLEHHRLAAGFTECVPEYIPTEIGAVNRIGALLDEEQLIQGGIVPDSLGIIVII
jgi:hypothetical protein